MRTDNSFDDLGGKTLEDLPPRPTTGEPDQADHVAAFLRQLRSDCDTSTPVMARLALTQIFTTGLDQSHTAVDPIANTAKRRKVYISLSTFVASLTGKIVIGTAVVVAAAGGAHAAGIADVPGLPDLPAVVDDADREQPPEHAENPPGQPDDPGVDGTEISDRATSGEPREDGRAFGQSVADEAREGTPAEGKSKQSGPTRNTPAAEYKPDDPPSGGSDTANDDPANPPAGRP